MNTLNKLRFKVKLLHSTILIFLLEFPREAFANRRALITVINLFLDSFKSCVHLVWYLLYLIGLLQPIVFLERSDVRIHCGLGRESNLSFYKLAPSSVRTGTS